MDILLPIPGFHKYAITRDGRVWSFKSQKFLSPRFSKPNTRHCQYGLRTNSGDSYKSLLCHRLVYMTFVYGKELPEGALVCHKDGDESNNDYTNLYLGTYRSNNRDTTVHGHRNDAHVNKISDQDVMDIMVDSRSCPALAKEYGCSTTYIERLRRGATRRHLTEFPRCPVPYLIPDSCKVGCRTNTNKTNSFGKQVIWDNPV